MTKAGLNFCSLQTRLNTPYTTWWMLWEWTVMSAFPWSQARHPRSTAWCKSGWTSSSSPLKLFQKNQRGSSITVPTDSIQSSELLTGETKPTLQLHLLQKSQVFGTEISCPPAPQGQRSLVWLKQHPSFSRRLMFEKESFLGRRAKAEASINL